MYWLAIPVAIAAAAVVKSILDSTTDSERRARETWAHKREETTRTVIECRRHVEEHLFSASMSYNFHFLRDLHHSSFRVADTAYALLQDAKVSVKTLQRLIDEANVKREALKRSLYEKDSGRSRNQISDEMRLLKEFRTSLISDIREVQLQREALQSEVRKFNGRTSELKLAIRDRCGKGGRMWFARLEARREARRR